MKSVVTTVALAAFAAMPCAAQVSEFFPYTHTVLIDCVLAYDGSQPVGVYNAYRVNLFRTSYDGEFLIQYVEPREYDPGCTGFFDTSTQLYRDVVNVAEESYSVTLRRTSQNALKLESATWRGPATSSVWTVTNGQNTVYLAGTLHILRDEDYPLPRAFDEAYAEASSMYFEIDMDDPHETGEDLSEEEIRNQLLDPQGRTVAQVLTPENYAALYEFMTYRGLTFATSDPWSVQTLVGALAYNELVNIHGFSADGVDEYIANRAEADGKPIHGLETRELHYSVLDAVGEDDENAIVEEFMADFNGGVGIRKLYEMRSAWRRGDMAWINTNDIEPMREHEYDDYLLVQVNRNNAWMPQIEAMLQSAPTEMVVVGAAHMAGEDGLVAQLRRRGYSVEKY